jgi:hypothetical protein
MKALMILQNLGDFNTRDDSEKKKFHTNAKKVLHEIGSRLGLSKSDFDVRSNKAGSASSGDITFHSDKLYITIGGVSVEKVMYRSCNGRKDYSGGSNQWTTIDNLLSDSFIDKAKRIQFS